MEGVMMENWTNAKLCDVANLVLGAILFFSPWMFGFEPRLASPIKNRWPAVTSRAAPAVVSAHCGPSLWTIQAAAGPKPPRVAGEGAPSYRSWQMIELS